MSPRSRRQVLRSLGIGGLTAGLGVGVRTSGGWGKSDADTMSLGTGSDSVEWHTSFGEGGYQCHTITDTSSGVLLVGRTGSNRAATPWLAEVRSDAEPEWTTTFDTEGYTRAVDVASDDSGYMVLATTDEPPAIRLVKLDSDGDAQWRRELSGPDAMADENGRLGSATNTFTNNAHVLVSTPDGYLIGGYDGRGPNKPESNANAWLRAVDRSGETQWERLYDATDIAHVSELDDGYLLAGNATGDSWLQAISGDGDVRWRHTYGGVGSERAVVALPTDDGIVYGGRSTSASDRHSQAFLVRTTNDGGFVWRRTFDPQDVTDLVAFGDGFVLTGEPPSADRSGRNPEKPVLVVDRWGRVRRTATVSVDPGTPIGLGRLGETSVAVGGWNSDRGIWLARIVFSIE